MVGTDPGAILAHLATAVDTSEDAVVLLDADGVVLRWNRGAHLLLGYDEQAALGRPLSTLVPPAWQLVVRSALGGQPVERVELSVQPLGRLPVYALVTAVPVREATGAIAGLSVVARDVTEQRLAQQTLAENARRVAESEELAHVGSWTWDAGSDAVSWSEELHRIHGLDPIAFAGTLDAHLGRVHPVDRPRVGRAMRAALASGTAFELEYRILQPDRTLRWVYARATLIVGPAGQGLGLRGIYQDITDRHENAIVLQEANQRLTQLALYDRLTGLPNRVLLVDRLERSLARSRETGSVVDLLCLGVDDFRTINASAGHDAGEQVLSALTPVLRRAVQRIRPPQQTADRLLARVGGDEFAIVLDDDDPRMLAESVQELLQEPLQLPDSEVFLSVTIGSSRALPLRTDATPEVLITEANIAMYEAKQGAKRHYVSFEPRMHEAARVRHRLGHELHQALARDQFVVRYQPVVDLESGHLKGVEALVRWQHPARGLVPPDAFIARTEETGLIVALGRWVLEQSCAQAVAWHRASGRWLTVAVNVSGRQLREPDFIDVVRRTLDTAEMPPDQLFLEMTESILMERDDVGLDMLQHLREDGVHLAIDDFGTGYSSLAALRRMPVDQLKIDRSFVAGLPDDDNAATIDWAVVHLGHALELSVLAEGVETAAQRENLLHFGCDQAQGFLFGAALPPDEITHLLVGPERDTALPRPLMGLTDD